MIKSGVMFLNNLEVEGGMVFSEKWCRFLKLEFTKSEDVKSRLVLVRAGKSLKKERGRHRRRGMVVFQKTVPILETRIYLSSEDFKSRVYSSIDSSTEKCKTREMKIIEARIYLLRLLKLENVYTGRTILSRRIEFQECIFSGVISPLSK